MTFAEVIERVKPLAAAIHDYWAAELPKRHPNYPLVNPGEEDGHLPAEEKVLREFLERQPDEVIYKLLLLNDVGTWVLSTGDLASRYEQLRQAFAERRWAIEELIQSLSDEEPFADRVAEMEERGIDMEHFSPNAVSSKV